MLKRTQAYAILACVVISACCESYVNNDEVKSYTVSLLARNPIVSSLKFSVLEEDDLVDWDKFFIELDADLDSDSETSALTISLFPKAHATLCDDDWETTQKITKFSIVSDSDFSASYPAGSELSSLFLIDLYIGDTRIVLDSRQGKLAGYLSDSIFPAPRRLFLKLNERPEFSLHTFTFSIELDDGSQFNLTANQVNLVF